MIFNAHADFRQSGVGHDTHDVGHGHPFDAHWQPGGWPFGIHHKSGQTAARVGSANTHDATSGVVRPLCRNTGTRGAWRVRQPAVERRGWAFGATRALYILRLRYVETVIMYDSDSFVRVRATFGKNLFLISDRRPVISDRSQTGDHGPLLFTSKFEFMDANLQQFATHDLKRKHDGRLCSEDDECIQLELEEITELVHALIDELQLLWAFPTSHGAVNVEDRKAQIQMQLLSLTLIMAEVCLEVIVFCLFYFSALLDSDDRSLVGNFLPLD